MRNKVIAFGLFAAACAASVPAMAQVTTGVGVVAGAVVGGPVGAVVGGAIGNSLDRRPYRVVPTPRQTANALTPRRRYVQRRTRGRVVQSAPAAVGTPAAASTPAATSTSVTAGANAANATGTTTTVVH